MPTHFKAGLNTEATNTPGYEYPQPVKYNTIEYFNDFLVHTIGDWTLTETGVGTDALSSALGAEGGALVLTNAAAAPDAQWLQLKGEAFRWSAGKKMWFESRFKTSDATQSEIIFGLQITDTTPLDATDGIYFNSVDASAVMNFRVNKNSTITTTTTGTLANDTWATVAFFYDNRDNLFHIFFNGNEVGTSVATNAPDDEDLTVSFGIQNGEAVAKTLTVDYIWAAQERTTTSWS